VDKCKPFCAWRNRVGPGGDQLDPTWTRLAAKTSPFFVKNSGPVTHRARLRAALCRLATAAPLFLKNGDFVREIGASAGRDDHQDDAPTGFPWGFLGSRRAKSAGNS
jgi:hypothetical protein